GAATPYFDPIGDSGHLSRRDPPSADKRKDPRQGGRQGTYWTGQTKMTPPSIHSTAFPEVTAGAKGRIAIAYMGSPDCAVGASDDCAPSSDWNVYVDFLPNALALAAGQSPQVSVGQVNHRVAHLGTICTSGTTCSGDRSLLDMMDVSYDSSGRASVIFMD